MLAIAFTFPAGRYHATPWGRHVNEADVAWPPDLWRITRAFIAVWHRKLDASRFPLEQLHVLLSVLAQADPPSFRLPEIAIHSHTRHYMPGKGDKKSLVFDAFARIASDDPIVIAWPSLDLDTALLPLLDTLLENLGYLGRAESWVEARRSDDAGPFNCIPLEQEVVPVDDETGEVTGEIVRLLAPSAPEDYAALRDDRLSVAIPGMRPAEKKKLAATLPALWLDAISVETSDLQAAGWNAPPAARVTAYRRPLHALRTMSPKPSAERVRVPTGPLPTTARFAIYGKPLPRLEDSVRVGESLRRATMGLAKRLLGADSLPPELSGHDLEASNRHGHAFWLPEDANGDGAIDHLVVYAPQGFGSDAIRVLTALQAIWRNEAEPLRLMFEGVGHSALFKDVSAYASSTKVWRSFTPYLYPWHLKKPDRRSAEAASAAIAEQLRREWRLRGSDLPAIELVTVLPEAPVGGRALKPVHFHRFRSKRGLTQPDTLGQMLEIRFEAPVQGPLAMGFGCHFGLGLFVPSHNGDV